MSIRRFSLHDRLWTGLVVLGLFIPQVASANPVPSFSQHVNYHALIFVTVLAMALEVIVTAVLLGLISGIDQRFLLTGFLLLLNIATFSLFVLLIHPLIGSLVLTEFLILTVETYAVIQITRCLGDRPIALKYAFMITVAGNSLSFMVGLST